MKVLDLFGSQSLSDIDTSLGDLLIGKNALEEGLPFSGSIDELAIYNRVLSDSEVADFHHVAKDK